LNDFKGTKVTNPVVAAGVDALGDNFHGTVEIPNPSVYTIELVSDPRRRDHDFDPVD